MRSFCGDNVLALLGVMVLKHMQFLWNYNRRHRVLLLFNSMNFFENNNTITLVYCKSFSNSEDPDEMRHFIRDKDLQTKKQFFGKL